MRQSATGTMFCERTRPRQMRNDHAPRLNKARKQARRLPRCAGKTTECYTRPEETKCLRETTVVCSLLCPEYRYRLFRADGATSRGEDQRGASFIGRDYGITYIFFGNSPAAERTCYYTRPSVTEITSTHTLGDRSTPRALSSSPRPRGDCENDVWQITADETANLHMCKFCKLSSRLGNFVVERLSVRWG